MERFASPVVRMESAGQVVLWHGLTGRYAALAPQLVADIEACPPGLGTPPDLKPVTERLHRLHLLAESAAPDLSRLIPAASRLLLLLPAVPALWLPMPAVRTPGGHAYAERRLTAGELAFWRQINGARTVAAAATRAGLPLEEALAFLAELTHPSVQAVQLRERPVQRRDFALERLVAPERPPSARPAHQRGRHGETTLDHYHVFSIDDAATHFDDRETTVAHAFGTPHRGLGNQRYGARLYSALDARGLSPEDGGITLEIGPGTGELAGAWLAAREAAGHHGPYRRLDRSGALLEAQALAAPGSTGVLGNATHLPLPARSVDLVLSNEVIADLSAVPWSPDEPSLPGTPPDEVAERIGRYKLEVLPGRCFYNLGAWQLVEELARVLKPGGAAYLSEFGGLDETPVETEQLDHPEVSIHFGHLMAVARAVGLEATLLPLPELLGMDLSAVWLARHSYEALRARMRAEGRTLQARAWSPETLPLPWPVEGLHWVPLTDPGPGPLPTRFQALLLRAPPRG